MDAAAAVGVASAASDLAVLLDAEGVIQEVRLGSQQMPIDTASKQWGSSAKSAIFSICFESISPGATVP